MVVFLFESVIFWDLVLDCEVVVFFIDSVEVCVMMIVEGVLVKV